jgi:hypothetical protein
MLEGYLHRRFPGLIQKSILFGQVVLDIRNAPASSPLFHAKNLVDELNLINDYVGQFHHDTGDTIKPVSNELKAYAEKALYLVHSGVTLI